MKKLLSDFKRISAEYSKCNAELLKKATSFSKELQEIIMASRDEEGHILRSEVVITYQSVLSLVKRITSFYYLAGYTEDVKEQYTILRDGLKEIVDTLKECEDADFVPILKKYNLLDI